MPELPRYLTVTDAADVLAVTPERLRDLIHAGGLPAVDIAASRGGRPRWRIAATDLEAWLAGRRTSPTPRPVRTRSRTYTRRYY